LLLSRSTVSMAEEIDFDGSLYLDIEKKDPRYCAKAYVLLGEVLNGIAKDSHPPSAEDILDKFSNVALDCFGPLTYTVLAEWGVKSCEDVGEMFANICEYRKLPPEASNIEGSFHGLYDFKEEFWDIFEPRI